MNDNWMKTSDFAQLVGNHSPVNDNDIRAFCEDGSIPPEFAKRKPGREKGHWFIAKKGLRYILEKVLHLTPAEIMEVLASKPKANFKVMKAA